MKKRRDTFRRTRHRPSKPLPTSGPGGPTRVRHPPIEDGRGGVYPFHPDLVAGWAGRDGWHYPAPVKSPSLDEVLKRCPHRAILAARPGLAIRGLFMVPPDMPADRPIPDFVVQAALDTHAAGFAYLLFSQNEGALDRAMSRLNEMASPPAGSA